MPKDELSTREEEVVDLALQGMTNKAIALELGLSVATVNTYWLRIRLKVDGKARADTVAKVLNVRAQKGSDADDGEKLARAAEKAIAEPGLQAILSLLKMTMKNANSTAWVADKDLSIQLIVNADIAIVDGDIAWNKVQDVFQTGDRDNPAIAAHIAALDGKEAEVLLSGRFSGKVLQVSPFIDAEGEIAGCIGILDGHVKKPPGKKQTGDK